MNKINKYKEFLLSIEGISWWKDGKLGDEEENNETIFEDFKVGDYVICGTRYMWSDRRDKFPEGEINRWDKLDNIKKDTFKITKIGYCENVGGYTGQIVMLSGKWPWFQTTGMKKRDYLSEGISWWKDGKLGDEEDIYGIKDSEIEVGDMIRQGTYTYWHDGGGGSYPPGVKNGKWQTYTTGKNYRVNAIEYCDNVDGYAGYVVKIGDTWPWWQTTDMIIQSKKTNEGIEWYKDGKFTEDDGENNFEHEFQVGDEISFSNIIFWDDNSYDSNITNLNREGNWAKGGDNRQNKRVITKVDHVEDKGGYTGQIVMISGKWHWFQTTGLEIVKKSNEGISWWKDGDMEDDAEEENEEDDFSLSLGDRVIVNGEVNCWIGKRYFKDSVGTIVRVFDDMRLKTTTLDADGHGCIVVMFDDRYDLSSSALSNGVKNCQIFEGITKKYKYEKDSRNRNRRIEISGEYFALSEITIKKI